MNAPTPRVTRAALIGPAKFQDRKACALCLTTGAKRLITISEHYEIFGATD